MSEKFIENVWLETESCYKCGIVFAMPADFVRKRRDDNQTFYCPSGHGQIYSTNQLTKLRHELEDAPVTHRKGAYEDALAHRQWRMSLL